MRGRPPSKTVHFEVPLAPRTCVRTSRKFNPTSASMPHPRCTLTAFIGGSGLAAWPCGSTGRVPGRGVRHSPVRSARGRPASECAKGYRQVRAAQDRGHRRHRHGCGARAVTAARSGESGASTPNERWRQRQLPSGRPSALRSIDGGPRLAGYADPCARGPATAGPKLKTYRAVWSPDGERSYGGRGSAALTGDQWPLADANRPGASDG